MASSLTRRLLTRRVVNVYEYSKFTSTSCSDIIPRRLFLGNSSCQNTYRMQFSPLPRFSIHHKCFSSSQDENKGGLEEKEVEKKLSLFQKFKQMYRDYWYVLVPVHLVTSAAWFGGFYYMAKSGIDIVALLESWNVSEKVTNPLKDSSMGYIAVAYALYKISTPARYTVTLGGTTISINYLKKWGYIKPVPSAQHMRKLYQEKKDTLTKSMKETKEGIKEKKDHLIESLHEKKEDIKEKKDNILKTVSKSTETLKKQKLEIKEKISNVKEKT